jgi:LmbE family N-acetylglucosaminyl deacetylase
MNPYAPIVAEFARFVREGRRLPLAQFPPLPRPPLAPDAPKALIFSPHPDDEVIIGGLALRLLREARWNVLNVAVTQGSRPARQAERWQELTACCDCIGFGLVATGRTGLDAATIKNWAKKSAEWDRAVERIAGILAEHQPRAIFFPHDQDWNTTHVGTHHLVVDALRRQPAGFACHAVETEFWGQMPTPNLLVELTEEHVTDLITALTFHVGEVRRNPYHLSLPAWMVDNVRRGAELVGGQGGAAPDFAFGTLYRLRRWRGGQFEAVLPGGRFLPRTENAGALFG